jgi:hypothetical protein
MGFFKKIRLFSSYKKIIVDNRVNLEGQFNLRIDRASRIYTVLNIPEELYGEPYNIRKSDIDAISQTYITEYIKRLSDYLNSIGLSELYDFYEPIKKIDKYSYLIVLGFKPFNSVRYNNFIWLKLVPTISIISLLSLIIYILFI